MLFNSYEFIFVFLPITVTVYFLLAKYKLPQLAKASLVVASLAFYSYWDIRYLPLLLGSIAFNYTIGSAIERTRNKLLLGLGIIINLSLLGYYKYTIFFMHSFSELFSVSLPVPNIILPLGISFFTFTQIAYIVDTYRGETERYSLLNYSLFVTIFPHLIAGPILYHKDMIPQFSIIKNFVFSQKNVAIGTSIFCIGLFKKVALADTLAPWVKLVFDNPDRVSFFEAWIGSLGYAMQLYFDFSGYSEMAIGLGLMFNLSLPINFNSPYKATSIIDFWRRWHITLSTFLKNYLYIPMGGNREGEAKRMNNIILTMLIGGLWHGAGWTYIIWGGLHGIYLILNHFWRKTGLSMPSLLAWLVTFISVVIAWVFFRANNVHDAFSLLQAMFGFKGIILPISYERSLAFLTRYGIHFGEVQFLKAGTIEFLLITLISIVAAFIKDSNQYITEFYPNWKWATIVSLLFVYALLGLTRVSEFLYFQF